MAQKNGFRDKTAPYQFYLPLSLKKKGLRKAQAHGIHISKFMQMAWEQFIDRPIEVSMKRLRTYNKRKKTK